MNQFFQYPIQTINIKDKDYPESLKGIENPPAILYYKGCLRECLKSGRTEQAENRPCLAIVGARRASDYGRQIAFSFAKDLAGRGITIVSGLARGIDAFAHKGALEANGRTIAVLGTGLDEKIIYPQENIALAKEILKQNSCLASEYPPSYPGSRFTFPKRNRIIAGLCMAVLVVEAKSNSGALITARWAKRQNKKVFAAPGSIFSQNSRGCHFLLKTGAILAEKPNDILTGLKLQNLPLSYADSNKQASSQTERLIYNLLKQQGSQHIEEIINKTNLPPKIVSTAISLMELDDKIKNLGGNVYVKN